MKTLIDSQNILVVGGAGFIGSHMVLALKNAGYRPIILDNLSTGHQHAVSQSTLIVGDMCDRTLLQKIFSTYSFSAVMHFASCIEVSESVKNPLKYYQNNVAATLNLLEVMLEHNVVHFIFSSTAAIYGIPQTYLIDETHTISPINPYGRSKWMIEQIIQDLSVANGLRYAILRYFNAAGADPEKRCGEEHQPESHLIPRLLQTALGQLDFITLNGKDYPTPDGTCIRDYVHVSDLCSAHLLALKRLQNNEDNFICNLGTSVGYSVKELITAAQDVTQCEIKILEGSRRAGDPACLVANASLARRLLNWNPQYTDINIIIKHAWEFMKS